MKRSLFFLIFSPLMLLAQINESDSLKFKGKLSLTGFWQDGNVETLIFRAKSDVSIKPWRNWVFKSQNSFVYQEFGKEKADEDFLSLNFLYLNPEKKLYPLILAIASTNFRREIDVRYLVGAGATYQILQGKDNWLKLSLTGEYEHTNFSETGFNYAEYDTNENIRTARGTLWVNGKYSLFKKRVILTHESYFQPSLEKSNNFRWRMDLGMELPVWKFLNFKVNYLHTHESIVIKDQKQQDRFLTFGLTLKTYQ
ncbi:Protein of unknown function, DUF481 [Tenacibaculum sp. MAR_2009_124]|uniref:DUF481 domain-containing protein n=1 Tax=Tenacibaculum sp. MAR_2009_124 TaxID=1250059 RepID=UPI0008968383|nr:DUF481 domain-containing protein [Tenacibaculum sp. MAR_2009_124]SEB76419.1 Protein of unknown function, DUF481 [Tenacibaculum sp. MAR_2009_124]